MNIIVRNIILGITLAAPLGPASLAVIQSGLRQGFLRAALTGIGITLADTTYLLVVFFGLSEFIEYTVVKASIWVCGTLVLFYLAVQSFRDAGGRFEFAQAGSPVSRNPVLVGYLVNISNPLAIVFWVGIFGSLLSASTGNMTRMEALFSSSTILIGILSWHVSMSFVSQWGRRFLNTKTAKVINVIAGLALTFFALRFGYNAILTIAGK
ncbi:MAG: hypothetical protein EHM41_12360 [Chloroflexi bacterium]|nr:MAG: hypothetical protein EHM41_12360 [Chloroflexota bacterium]